METRIFLSRLLVLAVVLAELPPVIKTPPSLVLLSILAFVLSSELPKNEAIMAEWSTFLDKGLTVCWKSLRGWALLVVEVARVLETVVTLGYVLRRS